MMSPPFYSVNFKISISVGSVIHVHLLFLIVQNLQERPKEVK